MKILHLFTCALILAIALPFQPLFSMEPQEHQEDLEAHQEECSICSENLDNGLHIATLQCNPEAPHRYHYNCLKTWCINQEAQAATCPLCRAPVQYHDIFDSLGFAQKNLMRSMIFLPNVLSGISLWLCKPTYFHFSQDNYFKKILINVTMAFILTPEIRLTMNTLNRQHNVITRNFYGATGWALKTLDTILLQESINYALFRHLGYSTNFVQRTSQRMAVKAANKVINILQSYLAPDTLFLNKIEHKSRPLEISGVALGMLIAAKYRNHINNVLEDVSQTVQAYIANTVST